MLADDGPMKALSVHNTKAILGKIVYTIMKVWFGSFVWFDSLRPSKQFFSHVHVGTGLPGLNQF